MLDNRRELLSTHLQASTSGGPAERGLSVGLEGALLRQYLAAQTVTSSGTMPSLQLLDTDLLGAAGHAFYRESLHGAPGVDAATQHLAGAAHRAPEGGGAWEGTQPGGRVALDAPFSGLASLALPSSAPAAALGAFPRGLSLPVGPAQMGAVAGAHNLGTGSDALSIALLQAAIAQQQQQQQQMWSVPGPASVGAVSPVDLLRSLGRSAGSTSPPEPSLAKSKDQVETDEQKRTALLEYENEVLRQRLQQDGNEKMGLVQLLYRQMEQNKQGSPGAKHWAGSVLPASLPGMGASPGITTAGVGPGEKPRLVQSRYWTDAEHQRFLDAVQRFGAHDHKSISMAVGTRTSSQVRSHSQKFFKKLEAHKCHGVPKMNRKKQQEMEDAARVVDSEG